MSDPHDWNSWDNYRLIHDARLSNHPFVEDTSLLQWTIAGDPPRSISLEGTIICARGVAVRVYKLLDAREAHGQLEIRGTHYAYNASLAGQGNILRYDNGHRDVPDEFHRHVFDLTTGQELSRDIISRNDMPTLAGFLDEVQEMIRI